MNIMIRYVWFYYSISEKWTKKVCKEEIVRAGAEVLSQDYKICTKNNQKWRNKFSA